MSLLVDESERGLFRRAGVAVILTLLVALVALAAIMYVTIRILMHGVPLIDPEVRPRAIFFMMVVIAGVFLLALGGLAYWVGRMVARFVQERDRAFAEKEMRLAADIQTSAMPQTFPAFPDVKEFDIYAMMRPARDVGGDFYDFYFSRSRRLVFLVADVSGKGVPAALFMMRAKSLLKGFVQTGIPLAEAVMRTNEGLCEGNAATIFVTAWVGELNFDTGVVTYVNAGHNRPILRRRNADGTDYIRDTPGLFLGAMPGIRYVARRLHLEPGDSIYLYTDGITEQVNLKFELFGEERLLYAAKNTPLHQRELLERISHAVQHHQGTTEQTDDCTQLEVVWRGRPVCFRQDYPPTQEGLARASADLESFLASLDFGPRMELLTAADEIVTNIISYSGATKWSLAADRCAFPDEVRLVFTDDGKPFDPLKIQPPDTSVAVEDRTVGGLGIFIVKQTMSPVSYAYHDGHNILSIGKSLGKGGTESVPNDSKRVPLSARIIRRKGS